MLMGLGGLTTVGGVSLEEAQMRGAEPIRVFVLMCCTVNLNQGLGGEVSH